MKRLPLLVDIKRHSLEDGPGIRTVVFFKGCPLRCVFCHNPETQNLGIEMSFNKRRCLRCKACAETCRIKAISFSWFRLFRKHRKANICSFCGNCATVCPASATKIIGKSYSVDELVTVLEKDARYFSSSGGGVTMSGGECLLFMDYLGDVFRKLQEKKIHTLLETSGHFDFAEFSQKIFPYVDLIYFDIKFVDDILHKKYTGSTNLTILDNFKKLQAAAPNKIHPRIPLVPGMTATKANLSAIAKFLRQQKIASVSLLPYNPGGIDKSSELGRDLPKIPRSFQTPNEIKKCYEYFSF